VPTATSTPTRLLEAALEEFAAHGFDGASTRAIAARAGVHQPQINYHFDGKEALWRAAVDHLFTELDDALADAADRAEAVRRFVRFAAARPELNRIMVQEATSDSGRLEWIVERHVRARYELVTALVGDGVDPLIAYYSLIGAASLLYVNAPEARRLSGRDPVTPEVIEAHADLVVRLVDAMAEEG